MILVTGDVVLDHNVYEGERLAPDAPPGNGSYYEPIPGGALLTHGILNALEPGSVRFGLAQKTINRLRSWPGQFQTRALWHPVANSDKPKDGRHWALERFLGYGEPKKPEKFVASAFPGTPTSNLNESTPEILVFDDGGLGFRAAPSCWPAVLSGDRPAELQWVILKMSRPLATGDLWLTLMHDSWRQRLIVIVSADQLRSEGLRVAGGLSWETSVDDIVSELESNRALRGLLRCRHLIVTLRGDAALWLDQPCEEKAGNKLLEPLSQLIFDRTRCEGEWEETSKRWKAYGFQSIVTASVVWSVAQELKPPSNEKEAKAKLPPGQLDFTVALAAGLSGTRFLRQHGHGPVTGKPAFPFAEAAGQLKAEIANHRTKEVKHSYCAAQVRGVKDPELTAGRWTILGQVSPWHARKKVAPIEPARHVAIYGPDRLPGVPCATFGKLQTLDRKEIDSLRSLRQLMLLYRDGGPRKQPLCLAVFGAPGSGKSFGLKQIAKGVFDDKTEILEFNLSQFEDARDLIGAFHQVRDKVLSGATPVVFWDEFDSGDLKWLRYLLAPMQDGQFQDGQLTHFVGKSVFVFAGGTSHTFEKFNLPEAETEGYRAFKYKKGPDFLSRLAGYLDIAGPNKRPPAEGLDDDREYPVRRAMVIRIALDIGDRELQIERGLLTALLAVEKYKNGARSLDKLVNYIKERGGFPLRRAYLPPDDMLALYVEKPEKFHELTRKFAACYAEADILAPAIHNDWLARLTPAERLTKENVVPWDELNPDIRDSNYAAALRIPAILELVGLTMEEGATTSPEAEKILTDKNNLELMAEAEHGGWEEQKRIGGWTYSRNRMGAVLRHDLLVPYERLTEKVKDYDRESIGKYPKNAGLAGFGIVAFADYVQAKFLKRDR